MYFAGENIDHFHFLIRDKQGFSPLAKSTPVGQINHPSSRIDFDNAVR